MLSNLCDCCDDVMDDETLKFLLDNGIGAGGFGVVVMFLTMVWRKLHSRLDTTLKAYDVQFAEINKCLVEVKKLVKTIVDEDNREREARVRQKELEDIVTRLQRPKDKPDDDTST